MIIFIQPNSSLSLYCLKDGRLSKKIFTAVAIFLSLLLCDVWYSPFISLLNNGICFIGSGSLTLMIDYNIISHYTASFTNLTNQKWIAQAWHPVQQFRLSCSYVSYGILHTAKDIMSQYEIIVHILQNMVSCTIKSAEIIWNSYVST